MNTDIENITTGIQFTSYIAVNRYLDKQILKDSKLLTLMVYIALRAKRSSSAKLNNWDDVKLEIGEFIIGRLSAVQETDLTEAEYRSRLKKLQALKIIDNLQPTSKFTKGKWVENSFIDINLELSIIQPNNQQSSNGLTINNNTNNPIYLIVNSLNNTPYSNDDYVYVISAYMQYKGIELKGDEIKDAFFIVKKIFYSERTAQQAIQLIQWFRKREKDESYRWVWNWTLNTVQSKLPEFLAGKLRIPEMGDDIPEV